MKLTKTLIYLAIPLVLSASLSAHFTRGTQPGELYYSSVWYDDWQEGIMYSAIFHSTDYGENLEIIYAYPNDDSNMINGYIYADATPGVLYNNVYNEFWRSFNNGDDWEYVEEIYGDRRYATGCTEGEIYKSYHLNDSLGISRSTDYGTTYESMNDTLWGSLEVGTETGEVFFRWESYYPTRRWIHYSFDYAVSFDSTAIDTTLNGIFPSGRYPKISHGALPGEIYYQTWDIGWILNFYFSSNYGHTFELRSQYNVNSYYNESYTITAGREPGEFYLARLYRDEEPNDYNYWLEIYHSADSAATFTQYRHYLNEDFNSVKNTNQIISEKQMPLNSVYPNPFNPTTTIAYTINEPGKVKIEVFNIKGQLVEQLLNENKDAGTYSVVWDGKDSAGNSVGSGVYFCRLKCNKKPETHKLLLMK